jgi:hypothetical protein
MLSKHGNAYAIEYLRRQNAQANNGGQEVILAYGLNKNLKKFNQRPQSAKPLRKKVKKTGGQQQ